MNKTYKAGILLGGALVALLSGCASKPIQADYHPSTGPLGGKAQATGSTVAEIAAEGPIHELTYDPAHNVLWYVIPGHQPQLASYNVGTRKILSFALPTGLDTGLLDHVRVAPDGSVWLTSGYSLIRVNPASGAIARKDLPPNIDGALSTAKSQGSASVDTEPSAIAFTADSDVLVARDNTPFLEEITPGMSEKSRIALDSGSAGMADMAFDSNGLLYAPAFGRGNGPVKSPKTLPVPAPPAGGSRMLRLASGGASGPELAGDSGQSVKVDNTAGTVVWTVGGVTRSIGLPSETTQQVNPLGQSVTRNAHANVTAAATDGSGQLWFVQVWAGKTELMTVH